MIETDDPIATLERELVRVAAATATPVPPGRRRRRRRAFALAGALAAVVVAAVTVLELSGGGHGPDGASIAEAAYAKLTPHHGVLVLRTDTRQRLGFGPRHSRSTLWVSPTAVRVRTAILTVPGGRLISILDSARTGRTITAYDAGHDTVTTRVECRATGGGYDPTAIDPVAGIRRQLARHELRSAGLATFDGRRVERLVSTKSVRARDFSPPLPVSELLVDPHSGDLIASIQRPIVGGLGQGLSLTRFLSRATLPRTPANLALLRVPAHPGARHVTFHAGHC